MSDLFAAFLSTSQIVEKAMGGWEWLQITSDNTALPEAPILGRPILRSGPGRSISLGISLMAVLIVVGIKDLPI